MNKILWVDDDINSGSLKAFVDEFSDEGIEIIKVNNPDRFQGALDDTDFDCLIMDMMMPIGENLSLQETKGGLHTGLRLLERYLKKGNLKPIVIFTILNDETITNWAAEHDVPHKLKQDVTAEFFFKFIESAIKKSNY